MEKESKSSTGVLLRADLTGHGHPSPFCQNGWDGCTLLGQPSKGHPCRILFFFHKVLQHYQYNIKKLETYFALLYFWTIAVCRPLLFVAKFIYFWQKRGQCTSTEKEQSKFTYLHLLGNATYRTYVMCSVVLDMTENLLYYNSMHWSCI